MPTTAWLKRRGQLQTYFDRTAVAAWERLTSDAPVGRIRQTVRAGRDRMRETLLDWLPEDLRGARLLDAGCGTGALAVAAARRGARVLAIDLSPTLVNLARERAPADLGPGAIDFRTGDMLDLLGGDVESVDYVVAMDSLIHYPAREVAATLGSLAGRTRQALLFTFAPKTPALRLMHGIGRLFPSSQRAPAIEPVAESELRRLLGEADGLQDWRAGRSSRIASGFYTSQAFEVVRA